MNAQSNAGPKRHAEIVDAAAAVFAEKGYHGASTKDIAARLGIQQAGIYYYFRSKDAALAEVCRLGVAGFVEHARAIAETDQATAKKIRQAIAAHLRPFHHLRDHVRVFHNERRYLAGENRRQVSKLAADYQEALEQLFAEGIRDGALRRDLDPRLATLALLGMCNQVSVWYRGEGESEIEAIADSFADIILVGALGAIEKED